MNERQAYKLNAAIIKTSPKPHERDLAKMRIRIIKQMKKRRRVQNEEEKG